MTVELGAFVKTCSPQIVEVLGTAELDFAVVDAEHAPFDRGQIDLMVMAGRASGLPVFVRVPGLPPPTDLPSHVATFEITPEQVEDLVAFIEAMRAGAE